MIRVLEGCGRSREASSESLVFPPHNPLPPELSRWHSVSSKSMEKGLTAIHSPLESRSIKAMVLSSVSGSPSYTNEMSVLSTLPGVPGLSQKYSVISKYAENGFPVLI
jgi:hypothetical protein